MTLTVITVPAAVEPVSVLVALFQLQVTVKPPEVTSVGPTNSVIATPIGTTLLFEVALVVSDVPSASALPPGKPSSETTIFTFACSPGSSKIVPVAVVAVPNSAFTGWLIVKSKFSDTSYNESLNGVTVITGAVV